MNNFNKSKEFLKENTSEGTVSLSAWLKKFASRSRKKKKDKL